MFYNISIDIDSIPRRKDEPTWFTLASPREMKGGYIVTPMTFFFVYIVIIMLRYLYAK